MEKEIKIALVDDHLLFRKSLTNLINSFDECNVVLEIANGKEFIVNLNQNNIPDLVILDLNMPVMDGFDTISWLQQNQSSVLTLMLTMYESELTLLQLLKLGARGFLKKDVHPNELRLAIRSVYETGYYYNNRTTGRIFNLFRNNEKFKPTFNHSFLNETELKFLKLACTDYTYKEIAHHLTLNPRTVDTMRDQLFIKLDVKSRVGLAMMAVKNGIVTF